MTVAMNPGRVGQIQALLKPHFRPTSVNKMQIQIEPTISHLSSIISEYIFVVIQSIKANLLELVPHQPCNWHLKNMAEISFIYFENYHRQMA